MANSGLCVSTRNAVHIAVIPWLLVLSFSPVVPARSTNAEVHESGENASSDTSPIDQRDDEYALFAKEAAWLEQQGKLLKRVVKLSKPSVVHIEVKKYDDDRVGFGVRRSVEETGSGVVVRLNHGDDAPYILTNLHVVAKATPGNIHIRLSDGRQVKPTRVWSDPATDLAVLAVSTPQLVCARIGDSDKIEVGDFVLAIGSPFGLSHSVTFGIISAKGRRDLDLGSRRVAIKEFLQTDAAINPGNSGGPLLNLRGEVVGINTAIASSSGGNDGIGFSIPINMAMVVARQLVANGSVVYAYLGVRLDSAFTATQAAELRLPRLGGALVKSVNPDSPAENAKIQAGDVITRFSGIEVEDITHLVNLVKLTPVGKQLPVEVFRDGVRLTVRVTVQKKGNVDDRH